MIIFHTETLHLISHTYIRLTPNLTHVLYHLNPQKLHMYVTFYHRNWITLIQ